MISLIETTILVGLLYSLLTIGLSLSFRVLNYPDLTLEGSVILGGALCYLGLNFNLDPTIALLLGSLGGAAAGVLTAALYLYCGVSKLLSGIITSAILYSVNIRLLGGKSNVRFENIQTIFTSISPGRVVYVDIVILAVHVLLVVGLLTLLFKTKLGYLLRTLGDNESYLISLGENPKMITLWGLGLANAVIGLGGAVLVQYKSTVDINMSFGLLIACLAAMVLGETILSAKRIWSHHMGSVVGTLAYNLAVALVLFSWSSDWDKLIWASDVRLVTGLLFILPTMIKLLRRDRFQLFKSEW